jgi:hypothetical protein
VFDAVFSCPIEAIPSRTSLAQESRFAENAKVLRDRRSRHLRESCRDLDHRKLPRGDETQYLAPVRLGDRFQGEIGSQCYSRKGCGFPDSANAFRRPTIWPHV